MSAHRPPPSARIDTLTRPISCAINRALARRGRVLADRFHTRALRTSREVRICLAYVLANFRKHQVRVSTLLDPCSSALWFDGFRGIAPAPLESAPVHAPRTWLARVGWRRHGLISPREGLVSSPRRRASLSRGHLDT